MGQQQLLLTLGAIVAFSLVSLSINRNMVRNSEAIYQQQAEFYALNLTQRFIEEAKAKEFDELSINNVVSNTSGFTGTGSFGPVDGSYPYFDDVDDFHGLSITDTTTIGPMTVNINVAYVKPDSLNYWTGSKQFYKKMTVTVQSVYLNDPVTASYVFAYQKNH